MEKPKDGPRPICFNGFSSQEALLNGLPRCAPRTHDPLPPGHKLEEHGDPIRGQTEVREKG